MSRTARNAIPEVRFRNFSEPSPGGKSHLENFEKNGRRGEDIFRHPHFVSYLTYFIDGPDLPRITIDGFRKILMDDLGTSGMMDQLCTFVRAEVRRLKLDRTTAKEEFWRLAQEVRYFHAETIWRAARSAAK